MKIISAFLLFIVCVSKIDAQQFRYEAKIDAVDSDGFYKIELSPQIVSRLNESHSDLRIVDDEQKQVAYIKPPSIWTCVVKPYIVPYTILEKKIFPDSISYIIIHNENKATISSFNLQITNADVSKQFSVSGCSDYKKGADKINWFVVKNSAELAEFKNNNAVTTIKQIDFPASSYEYYKIEMNDRKSKPLNILNCLHEEWLEESKEYVIIEPKRVTISDSVKTKSTWIEVFFDKQYEFDRVAFQIKSPKYFQRTIKQYENNTQGSRWREWEIKTGDSLFELPGLKTNRLLFSIENYDNPPLNFSFLHFYWRQTFIVAYLEKSKSYQIRFGNDTVGFPSYDLKYFEKLIPSQLTTLKIGNINETKNIIVTPAKRPYTFFTDKKFIWAAIALIILLLGAVTFRMLKEK
jgi:hypothetical protein